MDVSDDEKQPAHPGGVHQAHRDQGQVHRGHQRQRRVLRQDQAAARRRPGHRPRPHRASPTGWPPASSGSAGRRSSTRRNLPHAYANLLRAVPHPRLGPGPRLLLPLDRHPHRHRVQREGDRRPEGRLRHPAARRPDAQGPGRLPHRDARHRRHDPARPWARTRRTSPPPTSTRRSAGSRRPSTRSRSAASPATTTPPTSTRATSPPASAWAGDIIQLQADNPDIKFAIPAAGYITSSDNLLVPAQARHKTNAEKLIDYYYEPPVAAQLAAYINYVCPVDGVRDELAKIDEDAGGQPADPPRRGDGGEVPRLPLPEQRGRDGVRREVRQAHRRLTAAPSVPHRPDLSELHPTTGTATHDTQQQTAGGDVRLAGISKTYGSFTAVHPLDLTVPAGLLLRPARRLRLRQDHHPAHDRRPGGAHHRHRPPRRPGRHRPAAVQAAGQHRLPELRALPAPRHLRERRLRAAPARHQVGEEAGRRHAGARPARRLRPHASRTSSPAASSSASPWPAR